MTPGTGERFLWGPFRFFLGMAQIAFVALSVGALLTVGLTKMTWTFVAATSALTLLSILIYKRHWASKEENHG